MKSFCLHCGLENKNTNEKFCCNGCATAYAIINNLGLQNYYHNRLLDKDAPALKPEENYQIDINQFINPKENNSYSIDLMVEGLHCAACVWLIENVLKKQPSVQKARINMTSKKLYLQWLGAKEIGNDLVKLIFDLGYKLIPFDKEFLEAEEKKYDNNLLKALAVSGFAAGNVMLISISLWANDTLQMGVATRNLLYWVSALIALPAVIYSGQVFFISAIKSIKTRRANMDVPIAVAIILTSIISIVETINKGEHAYFDSAIMLVFFLLIGRYLDFSARRKAFSITRDLMMLSGVSATIIDNGKNKIIASKDLKKDMILLVAMGEKISADGVVIMGDGEIDNSVISGESLPKKIKIGDEVFAGTVNLGNALQVKITKAKEETLLAKIVKMVEEIESGKSYYTKIADQVAKYYTPIIHLLALMTFIGWYFIFKSPWQQSALNAITVLIITCPCALALAVPVVQIVAAGRLLKKGILLKNGEAIEKINKIDTIIFDKTGTLTLGKPKLLEISHCDEAITNAIIQKVSQEQVFQIAASMSAKSKHILSQAMTASFGGELLNLEVKEIPGMGLVADYNGQEVRLGSYRHCNGTAPMRQSSLHHQHSGLPHCSDELPQIYFQYQNQITIFTFQDQLRNDATEIIKKLKTQYKNIILLSGDKKSVVKRTAQELGIVEYYFEKTPDQKLEVIKKLKSENKNILMVGDGINDAPSLVLADISISPAMASDISKNIADIIFQGENLQPILEVLEVAKKSNRIIKENLLFSLIYNCLAVPFAVAGYIVPLSAALAMSSSSIVVVLNALRIRRGN